MKKRLLVIVLCVIHSNVLAYGNSPPINLKCEYLTDPVGIGTAEPRLNWQLVPGPQGYRQSAYRLIVASDESLLARDLGDLWDTTASVFLPTAKIEEITESGQPVQKQDLIEIRSAEEYPVVLEVVAGSYSFRCKYTNLR